MTNSLRGATLTAVLAVAAALSVGPAASAQSSISNVLVAGGFRTTADLQTISADNQRNTLIVELSNRTAGSVADYQAMTDAQLASAGALLVCLRRGIQDDATLATFGVEDMRKDVLNEAHRVTGTPLSQLQAMDDAAIVALATPPSVFPVGDGFEFGHERHYNASGSHYLIFQPDGNLVVYTAGGHPVWALDGKAEWSQNTRAVMQPDGNLVTYASDQPTWSSQTYGHAGATLLLDDDGALVIRSESGHQLWTSGS